GASNHVTVHVSGKGADSAGLSSRTDGVITVSIAATDTAGNTATGTGTSLTLDTTADVGGNLAVSVSDSLINNAEKTNVAFLVARSEERRVGKGTVTRGGAHDGRSDG